MKTRKHKLPAGVAFSIFLALIASAAAAQATRSNIHAQVLADPPREVGTEKRVTLDPGLVIAAQGLVTNAEVPQDQKLSQLLSGRKWVYETLSKRTADVIHLATSSQPSASESSNPLGGGVDTNENARTEHSAHQALEQAVVTGTYIRGIKPVGSPVTTYTRDEIDLSGAVTIEQFARRIPQNFSNADAVANTNSNARYSPQGGSAANAYFGSAFNLRGLGPSATLTLLNGNRLAPAGLGGAQADISQIPLSVVDHIEIMTDGASAIYGADAVTGIVNIITRKDFQGAETAVRYGGAADGGAHQLEGSQLFGSSWNGGNAFVSYEYSRQFGLDASERDYIPRMGGGYSLVPASRRNSVMVAGTQHVGDRTDVSGQLLFSDRVTTNESSLSSAVFSQTSNANANAEQLTSSLKLDRYIVDDWQLGISGSYSKVRQVLTSSSTAFAGNVSFGTTLNSQRDNSDTFGMDLLVNGPLMKLGSGSVKVAIGASFREESFESRSDVVQLGGTTSIPLPKLTRHVGSAYMEFYVPLMDFVDSSIRNRRLELSVAVRHDEYSDFGATTNPKIGLEAYLIQGLSVRTSYGTSYRPPLLSDLGGPVLAATTFHADPSGTLWNTLMLSGGNRDLSAEKSESFTVGLDLNPAALPTFHLHVTYFDVNLRNRILAPPQFGTNPLVEPRLAPFVILQPTSEDVQSVIGSTAIFADSTGLGAAGVQAIVDQRLANISRSRQSGLDLSGTYLLLTSEDSFTFSLGATRLLESELQTLPTVPFVTLMNTFATPPKFRGSGGVTWTRRGFTANSTFNYINSYENTLFTPSQRISSWTTVDLNLSYQGGASASVDFVRDLTIALSVTNVTNKRPPFAAVPALLPGQNSIPFDPTNASPIGRLVTVTLRKVW